MSPLPKSIWDFTYTDVKRCKSITKHLKAQKVSKPKKKKVKEHDPLFSGQLGTWNGATITTTAAGSSGYATPGTIATTSTDDKVYWSGVTNTSTWSSDNEVLVTADKLQALQDQVDKLTVANGTFDIQQAEKLEHERLKAYQEAKQEAKYEENRKQLRSLAGDPADYLQEFNALQAQRKGISGSVI